MLLMVGYFKNSVIIEKSTIIEKKLFVKREITFGQVDYLSLKKDNDIDIICVHSKTGMIIKVPNSYQNFEIFEEIIEKQHWHWKK